MQQPPRMQVFGSGFLLPWEQLPGPHAVIGLAAGLQLLWLLESITTLPSCSLAAQAAALTGD